MYNKLIIIGAGGHGKVVADIAVKTQKYGEIQFLDDNVDEKECMSFPIIGTSTEAEKYIGEAEFFVAIGNAKHRKRKMEQLEKIGVFFANLAKTG